MYSKHFLFSQYLQRYTVILSSSLWNVKISWLKQCTVHLTWQVSRPSTPTHKINRLFLSLTEEYTQLWQKTIIKVSLSICCNIFQKFTNKSHNMKALIILSHSSSLFFLLTYLYGENEFLCGPMHPVGVFSQEKTTPVSRGLICNETFLQNYLCPI